MSGNTDHVNKRSPTTWKIDSITHTLATMYYTTGHMKYFLFMGNTLGT
uniref:Uncharacterized protein n=1 Tax=Anguilla anguilla TaxID=7936 RepID=A0A0E9WN19_ANGAN